ncbi:hypothetical protein F2Q69_00012511 [Brassica cretica]|uniref:Zinc knuckle CX2CX4HX4C domain-containing protein n=1 Tax=Brassica cretica TaxID=69181 RepID=A0A8S9QVF9_BRACR|nr:hypothetical protein F2Q69_00012511 [Brassica cretica]
MFFSLVCGSFSFEVEPFSSWRLSQGSCSGFIRTWILHSPGSALSLPISKSVQVIGIPLHLWTDINLKNIGALLGHVHDDTLEVAEGRMLVDVDSRKPLQFSRKVESKDGDEATIEIKYEKLFKHCSTCGMLTHEKDHCPSVDMRSRLQPQSECPSIFTRMQAPQEIAQRHTFHREQGPKLHERQLYVPRLESSTRQVASSRYYEDDRKYAQRTHHPTDLHATHSDRIMRRRNDPNRGDRYGGSRASKGPYDRNKRQTWREKAETNMRLVTMSQPSTATATSSRQIVPYEQSSGISNNDLNGMVEQTAGRAKELTRSLSFTDLSDHEPVTGAGDNQIIGALNDMEIEDNQDDGMMDCEGMDEDLLGIDLKDMEEREALQVVSKATSGHVTSGTDIKVLKSSRQGTKVNVPLGLQNKKFEILRRGSPRKPSSSSQGAHTARDSTRSRKHSQSSKKQRDGSWTASDRFSGCGWVWMDSREDIQLMGTRNFTRCESALHSEKWPRFATELEKIETLQICFPDFKITHVPRLCNQFPDFLAKTARSFHMELLFIGCSIPVWLPRPPRA